MKLGLVTSFMPPHLGGMEQIAETLYAGYASRGVDVRWVSSHIPRSTPKRDGDRVRVPCFNLVEDLLGVPVPVWGPTGWAAVSRLADWADALHVIECLYLTSAMAVVLARRHGKPVVVSQNVGFVQYRFPPLNWLQRAAYVTLGASVLRRASHVVLATPTAAGYIAALCGDTLRQTSTFPVGIDTSRFRPPAAGDKRAARERLGLSADETIVLFAGRLVEKKGLPIVLDVCRRLPNVRFVVVGDGPLRDRLKDRPENVIWHQAVAPEQMPVYYHAADCVLLPSHGEGLPLVVQEAMASELPVIISEDEPYAEGLIGARVCSAAPRDPEAMAARLVEVIAGREPELGRRARSYAERHWGADTMVSRHLTLFETLLADQSRAGEAKVS
jgi:glycosyltransferase involved in cell wall biosynthesis